MSVLPRVAIMVGLAALPTCAVLVTRSLPEPPSHPVTVIRIGTADPLPTGAAHPGGAPSAPATGTGPDVVVVSRLPAVGGGDWPGPGGRNRSPGNDAGTRGDDRDGGDDAGDD